jgi:hypothetical protein
MRLTLILKDVCELCDIAWQLLADAGVADFDPLWIDDDFGLQARYGERVPVLRREDTGEELDWPFTADEARTFLR